MKPRIARIQRRRNPLPPIRVIRGKEKHGCGAWSTTRPASWRAGQARARFPQPQPHTTSQPAAAAHLGLPAARHQLPPHHRQTRSGRGARSHRGDRQRPLFPVFSGFGASTDPLSSPQIQNPSHPHHGSGFLSGYPIGTGAQSPRRFPPAPPPGLRTRQHPNRNTRREYPPGYPLVRLVTRLPSSSPRDCCPQIIPKAHGTRLDNSPPDAVYSR